MTPEKKERFGLPSDFQSIQSPSVEYRGIFINDEDWGLMPWSNRTFEPSELKGEIGPRTHERIFELLLRLRANTFWPAMHECTLPFFLTKGNREVAKKYGIFIGASHCEPMACNAAGEWSRRGKGAYDYVNNSHAVYQFWGRPHDHLWLGTMNPALIYQQMKLAYEQGIQKMWVLNVGDIKPAEYQIELFMDMAWNLNQVEAEGVNAHLKRWLEREMGASCAKAILPVMQEHYRLAYIRKPEFMGNTRVEERDAAYRVVKDLPWSEKEINERLQAYDKLSETAERAASQVPADRQSAYFELVKYPVQAAAQMNRKLLYAQLARHGKADWARSDLAYDSIALLTKYYNSLEQGKWNRMMDFKPRSLPVFNKVERTAATAPMVQECPAVYKWSGMDAKKGNPVACEGLGYGGRAADIGKGDALTFSFGSWRADSVEVDIPLLPNHPVQEGQLRFSVSLDDAEPVVVSYETKGRSEEWKENVLRNQAIRKITLPVAKKKSHKLVIKALDEGVVLDQIMLY